MCWRVFVYLYKRKLEAGIEHAPEFRYDGNGRNHEAKQIDSVDGSQHNPITQFISSAQPFHVGVCVCAERRADHHSKTPSECRTIAYREWRKIEEIFNVNFMFAHKFEFYNLTAEKVERFMHIARSTQTHTHEYRELKSETTLAGGCTLFIQLNASYALIFSSSKWKRLVAAEWPHRSHIHTSAHT